MYKHTHITNLWLFGVFSCSGVPDGAHVQNLHLLKDRQTSVSHLMSRRVCVQDRNSTSASAGLIAPLWVDSLGVLFICFLTMLCTSSHCEHVSRLMLAFSSKHSCTAADPPSPDLFARGWVGGCFLRVNRQIINETFTKQANRKCTDNRGKYVYAPWWRI